MKGDKITVSLRIDKNLWELAKMVLPCSRNAFIERQLRTYLNSIDEIKELENEIEQDTQDLQAKKERLEQLIEIRKRNDANVELMREAMTTVFNIVQSNGEISHEQIDFIAGSKKMTREALIKEIKKNKFKIVKYTKGERERRLKDVKI